MRDGIILPDCRNHPDPRSVTELSCRIAGIIHSVAKIKGVRLTLTSTLVLRDDPHPLTIHWQLAMLEPVTQR
jgi:hypothetical protein